MEPIEAARRQAACIDGDAVASGVDPWDPSAIVEQAIEAHGLRRQAVAKGDPCLNEGRARLDLDTMGILHERTDSAGEDALLVGHELGYVVMHGATVPLVVTHADPSRSAEGESVVEKLADCGRGERREVQADLFAWEPVLPRGAARNRHVGGMGVAAIAARLGIGGDVVAQQLLDALLLPLIPAPPEVAAAPVRSPIRARTPRWRTVAAASVWVSTLHAFGLGVVRRFHERLGRTASPELVDKATAITTLEDVLPSLGLVHCPSPSAPSTARRPRPSRPPTGQGRGSASRSGLTACRGRT